jgi:hypothetical protein
MDFIEKQEFAATEASRLRPAVTRLWWGLLALSLLSILGVLMILLHARDLGRQQEGSHRKLQESIYRLLAARGAGGSVTVARFRSRESFASGDSNCEMNEQVCNSWIQQGSNEGPVADLNSLLMQASSIFKVVIVEGAHDSQELSKNLRATVRDNENLALARAESVQRWLEGRVPQEKRPSIFIFPATRPTSNFDHPAPIDRSVWVTLIVARRDEDP